MKTMIAKYPGQCAACGQPIKRGDSINFYGRGRAEHSACYKAGFTAKASEFVPDAFDMMVEDNMRDACGL